MVQRLLRLLGYVAIGLVIAVLIGITTWYSPSSVSRMMSGGWVWLTIFTPIIFWYPIRQYRHLWRRPSFWLTLAALLVLHLLAFTLALRSFPLRPFWFMMIAGVEVALITIVLDLVLPRPHQSHRHDATQDL